MEEEYDVETGQVREVLLLQRERMWGGIHGLGQSMLLGHQARIAGPIQRLQRCFLPPSLAARIGRRGVEERRWRMLGTGE